MVLTEGGHKIRHSPFEVPPNFPKTHDKNLSRIPRFRALAGGLIFEHFQLSKTTPAAFDKDLIVETTGRGKILVIPQGTNACLSLMTRVIRMRRPLTTQIGRFFPVGGEHYSAFVRVSGSMPGAEIASYKPQSGFVLADNPLVSTMRATGPVGGYPGHMAFSM